MVGVGNASTLTTAPGSMVSCRAANVRDDMVDAYAGKYIFECSTRVTINNDLPCVARREETSATMQYMVGVIRWEVKGR